MPPPVKKRKNYTMDVSTLNRIATAVRDDDRLPREQREKIVSHLYKAMNALMMFDASTIGEDDESGEEEEAAAESADGQEEAEEESGPSAAE
jgi:hypothetical protein